MDTSTLREMPSSLNDACRKMELAADEIERLRAALRKITQMADPDRMNDVAHVALNEQSAP